MGRPTVLGYRNRSKKNKLIFGIRDLYVVIPESLSEIGNNFFPSANTLEDVHCAQRKNLGNAGNWTRDLSLSISTLNQYTTDAVARKKQQL